MKRIASVLLLFLILPITSASADWRWASPKIKPHHITYACSDLDCVRHTYVKERHRLAKKIESYNKKRLAEWKRWTRLYIPTCTWYGESGQGPEYARYRYTLPNSTGSGAYGKFQMMSGTYFSNARYGDWSPLDQEIAARREFWKHGSSPWANCG